jgi:hypothetical protein
MMAIKSKPASCSVIGRNYQNLIPYLMLICLLTTPVMLSAQDNRAVIEIVTVEHRDPSWIRTQLSSQLDPRGHIGQIDNKLVIATTVGNYQALREIIQGLDTPARRLVVSVDFNHPLESISSQLQVGSAQQSVQAIEGDNLEFIEPIINSPPIARLNSEPTEPAMDDIPLAMAGTNPVTPGRAAARLNMRAEIRADSAIVSVQLDNIAGFTGRHQLTVPLGSWYLLNPGTEDDRGIAIRVDALPC